MAEEDIAYLLSRGKLAEPLETEQSEINRLVDKSKVKDFIDQQKKKSTVNCTKRDLNIVYKWLVSKNELTLNRNESGKFGALKSDSTHHFVRNACTKSGSLRFSQFSGC
jgi:hypothetical protein